MPMINIAEAQGKVLDWLCAIALRLDLYGPADFLEQRNHHVKHASTCTAGAQAMHRPAS